MDSIINGWPVPEEYYRLGIDTTRDDLLRERGIKHLHLGGKGSDIILYAVEFDDFVELLEINTHVHLDERPRGHRLMSRFLPRRA